MTAPHTPPISSAVAARRRAVDAGERAPHIVAREAVQRLSLHADPAAFIRPLSEGEMLNRAVTPTSGALRGSSFAIKDNIDLGGVPTTAACPEFAYTPAESAPVVVRLMAAGAVPIGKTNLDQFATGLVGVRSPYGIPRNPFDSDYLPGGSSSGSAVAVAAGLCDFALGTDTAGSGRVPAAFNNLVGLKPTRGLLSTRGVVPACRSLDCVSLFTRNVADAAEVLAVAVGYDERDPFSRVAQPPVLDEGGALRIGVPKPEQLEFFGDAEAAALFRGAVERWQALGASVVEIDYAPFAAAARLLYEGPWVAERYVALQEFVEAKAEAMHPVTRKIIQEAKALTAVQTFAAGYRLAELRRQADTVWEQIDVLLTPTTGTVYRVAEVEAAPVQLNSNLGYYTNHMNLLDLCGLAVPAGFLRGGVPWGVTLSAPAFCDDRLLRLGARFLGEAPPVRALPFPGASVKVAVCGAHLSGLPLNGQLTQRGGKLVAATTTAPRYRLFALPGTVPPKPGLVRVADGGAAIAVEVWELPLAGYGSFVAGIPAPLGIGTLELADGSTVQGFLCESAAVVAARDITALGGWREFLRTVPKPSLA